MAEIGYKRPPKRTQFAKGKSGNPSGRPKGRGNASSLESLVNQQVTVVVEGVQRKMPLTEALVMSLAQRALAGNTPAAREFMKIANKVAEQQKIEELYKPMGPITLVPVVARSWIEQLERLEIVEISGEDIFIRKWVVQAALERNADIKFDDSERKLVLHHVDKPSIG